MIADLGSAKYGTFESIDHTNPIGTLHYRPPELLKHDDLFLYDGSKIDIYIIFWELLTTTDDNCSIAYESINDDDDAESMRPHQLALVESTLGIKHDCAGLTECTPTCMSEQRDVDYKTIEENIGKVIKNSPPDDALYLLGGLLHPNPTVRMGHEQICSSKYLATPDTTKCRKIDTWHRQITVEKKDKTNEKTVEKNTIQSCLQLVTKFHPFFMKHPTLRRTSTIVFYNGISIMKAFLKFSHLEPEDVFLARFGLFENEK